MKQLFSFLIIVALAAAMVTSPALAQLEQEVDTATQQKATIFQGDIIQLKVYGLTRIAVVEPGIFEIINATEDAILISGGMEGETSVFLWDSKGKRRFEVQVIPRDLDYIMARIQKFLDASQITGLTLEKNDLEGKIMVTGKILREKRADFDAVMDKFGQHIINLAKEDVQLVEIDVQITELSTTISKTMGIAWPTSLAYQETLPTFKGDFGDWFRIGDFTRTDAITATVNMLISEGKGRVLSKPNVVVTSGDDATFLVGGEIPITTTTTSEGNVSENVSYKSYGIDLTVTPEIKEDKIDITLSVSIRDLDPAHAVGDNTAFTTRSADTKLLLRDGQTVVLAGLIKENKSEAEQRVPFLSKIPVVGLLFRNKQWDPNTEIEVVISLTPRILKDKNASSSAEKATVLDEVKNKIDADLKEQEDAERKETEMDIFGKKTGGLDSEDIAPAAVKADDSGGPEEAVDAAAELAEKTIAVEDVSPAVTQYVQSVQQKIAQAISFPYEAKEKGLTGTTTLNLTILSDGSLNKAAVKESSGQEIFDKDALNTAQIVAPFAAFPAEIDLQEIEISVPITYNQEAVFTDKPVEQE